jgi:hypothetical protein
MTLLGPPARREPVEISLTIPELTRTRARQILLT